MFVCLYELWIFSHYQTHKKTFRTSIFSHEFMNKHSVHNIHEKGVPIPINFTFVTHMLSSKLTLIVQVVQNLIKEAWLDKNCCYCWLTKEFVFLWKRSRRRWELYFLYWNMNLMKLICILFTHTHPSTPTHNILTKSKNKGLWLSRQKNETPGKILFVGSEHETTCS